MTADKPSSTDTKKKKKGRRLTIYTDSKCFFLHACAQSGKGGLADLQASIYKAHKILQLLEALYLPKQVAVIHSKRHKNDTSRASSGNQRAIKEAERAAFTVIG